jgi:hypothetical protein
MPRLHYLYEQKGGGRERFVYYCSSCGCVLLVRRDLKPAGEAIERLGGRCSGCGSGLEDNVGCRLAPAPAGWSDVCIPGAPAAQRSARPFQPASSLPHFSLGFPRLDALLRPLSSQRLMVLTGAAASTVAELMAFRAQLPLELGGLDSAVLFIDGGNRSDPYLFSTFAKRSGVRPAEAMRRVVTCRVFTIYQLAGFVSERLAAAEEDYAAKLVVVSDLLGTFNEPELDEREARRLLSAVEGGLRRAAKSSLVLVTLPSPNKHDGTVAAWADVAMSFSPARGRIRAELVRHPTKPPTSSAFTMAQLLRSARAGGTG